MRTFNQRQQQIDDSECCLELFYRNKQEHERRQLMKHGSNNVKASEATKAYTAGKDMASVFWIAHGIFTSNTLTKEFTIIRRCFIYTFQG